MFLLNVLDVYLMISKQSKKDKSFQWNSDKKVEVDNPKCISKSLKNLTISRIKYKQGKEMFEKDDSISWVIFMNSEELLSSQKIITSTVSTLQF